MKTSINPEFSFTAFKDPNNENSNVITYFFEVDEDNKPIHLGDGSYGMVYRVSDIKSGSPPGKYAVKIFYDSVEIEERFQEELNYYEKIRGKISLLDLDMKIGGLIEPRGGSKSFDKSKVALNYFKDAKFKISPYAIVMDCFDGTLKDRLEVKGEKSTYTGYEALMACSYDQRIKAMYKFIIGITSGLKYLYIDNNAHLDIKPANVFYEVDGINYNVVLADVGFFSPKDVDKNPIGNSIKPRTEKKRQQLLGSIHYRSPEQKNDIDKCQAEIVVKETLKVVITDPKFKDSYIEIGDRLFFSKYYADKPHRIKSLVRSKENDPFKVEIELDSELDLKMELGEEQNTQVVLKKNQQLRTDIHGIGAIAFDILTCGNSPERFYDKICSQDFETNSVSNIIDKYSDVINQSNDESEVSYIFNSFVDNNKFANKEIVEFILKCMLYKAQGTFYHEFSIKQHKNDFEVIEEVLAYFTKVFQSDYADQIALNATMNPIITQKKVKEGEKTSEIRLNDHILKISQIPTRSFSKRLYHGIKSCEGLNKFLESNMLNPDPGRSSRNSYFAELRPEILFMDEHFRIRINQMAFPTEQKFFEGLLNQNAHNKLNTNTSNLFVPLKIGYFQRKIKLSKCEDNENEFYYTFLDRSYHSDDLKIGDYLVSGYLDSGKSELYRIKDFRTKSSNKVIRLEAVEYENTIKGDVGFKEKTFVYYRCLEKTYYMHMLAIYYQLLFFSNNGNNSFNLPKRIFSILYLDQKPFDESQKFRLKPLKELLNSHKFHTDIEKDLVEIIYLIVQLFLGLVLNEKLEDKYSINDINGLQEAFSFLRLKAIKYLGIGEAFYNQVSIESIDQHAINYKIEEEMLLKPEYCFETIIDNMLMDPLPKDVNIMDKIADSFKKLTGNFIKNQPVISEEDKIVSEIQEGEPSIGKV